MRHTTATRHTYHERHTGIQFFATTPSITRATALIVIFLLLPIFSFARVCTLSGCIATPDGKPLAGCSVILYAADNDTIPVAGIGSNSSGHYTLQATTGQYKLRASYIGKNTVWQHINLTTDTATDTIYMAANDYHSHEVTITACCIGYRNNGNIVVNIPGNPFALNSTPYEMIYKIPGTWGLTIYGEEITRLYINDIEQQISQEDIATLLKSLDINQVASIEIIPADTQHHNLGKGALRITLRAPCDDGLLISAGYTPSFDFGIPFSHDISLNAAARYKKLFSHTTVNLSINPNGTDQLHRDLSRNYFDGTTRQNSCNSSHWSNNILINQSLIYEIDSTNILQANFNARLQPRDTKWEESKELLNTTPFLYPDSSRTDWLQTQHNYSAYASYRHLFDNKGSKIEASLHYFRHDLTRQKSQQALYPDSLHQFAYRRDKKSDAINPAIDAVIALPYKLILQTGLQYIYTRKNNNHLQHESLLADYNFLHQSSEHFASFHAGLSGQYRRLHFTASLLLQYIHSTSIFGDQGNALTYNDFIAAPMLQLHFDENCEKGYATTLTFTTIPTIPMPDMLQPFTYKIGEYSYFTGNSNLHTAYNYSLKLQQQLFGDLTFILHAHWQPQALDRTISIANDGRSIIYSYQNYGKAAQYSTSLLYNRSLFPCWHIKAEATLTHSRYDSHSIGSVCHLSGNIQLTNSCSWGNGWTASLYASYRSSQRTLYTLYGSGYGVSGTIGKSFFNDRLSLRLEATDFITDFTDSSTTYLNHYTLQEINDNNRRSFGLNIVYRFGIGNKEIKGCEVIDGNADLRAM